MLYLLKKAKLKIYFFAGYARDKDVGQYKKEDRKQDVELDIYDEKKLNSFDVCGNN